GTGAVSGDPVVGRDRSADGARSPLSPRGPGSGVDHRHQGGPGTGRTAATYGWAGRPVLKGAAPLHAKRAVAGQSQSATSEGGVGNHLPSPCRRVGRGG